MALLAVVIPAAVIDTRTRRIPNALTLPAILIGLISWPITDSGGVFLRVLGLVVVVLVVGFSLYALGILGGGDAKLLASVAALMGSKFTFEALLWTALFGGAVALGVLAWHRALFPFLRRLFRAGWDMAVWRLQPVEVIEGEGHRIPYALVICGGVVLALIARAKGLSLIERVA